MALSVPLPSFAASESPAWVLGVARFKTAKGNASLESLGEAIPRLILTSLHGMPPRLVPKENLLEIAELQKERDLFQKGGELAAKLDERASAFLSPTAPPAQRAVEIAAASRKVTEAIGSLETVSKRDAGSALPDEGLLRSSRLCDKNAGGELLDPMGSSPGSPSSLQGIDFVLHGSLESVSGYVAARIEGYDVALRRRVFSWDGFCSPEDPEPLAREIAGRLESWIAGRAFGRLELSVSPASASLWVDGTLVTEGDLPLYRFEATEVEIVAEAGGYAPLRRTVSLGLGERRKVDILLKKVAVGSLRVETDPLGAAISLNSLPLGPSPVDITLDGSASIVSAEAPGRESVSIGLPTDPRERILLELPVSDGLGPAGRVASAKDSFYEALGWFVVSLPATALAAGSLAAYTDAAALNPTEPKLAVGKVASGLAIGATGCANVALVVIAVLRLISYLGAAR